MANIIYSPAIPYLGAIPGVVGPGFTVNIKGTIHPNCSRFGINLQCGPNICPRDDVLLHVGVDFIRGCVIKNSIHSNNWGPEEIQQGHFPFVRGAPFFITIVCESSHFNILINNHHFASFEHRIVYHRASHLAVDGDIILENIEYKHGSGTQSGLYPPAPGINPNLSSNYPPPVTGHYNTAPGYPTAPSSAPYPPVPGMPLPAPVSSVHPPSSSPYGQIPTATPYTVPQPHMPHSPHHAAATPHTGKGHQGVIGGLLNKVGAGGIAATAATAATAGLGLVGSKKAWKAQKKARKKALKYGLPLAGAGLGAYAISRAWSSSSSSSSSDEE